MFSWTIFTVATAFLGYAFGYDWWIWRVKDVQGCTSVGGCTYTDVRADCSRYYYNTYYDLTTASACQSRCDGSLGCGAFRFNPYTYYSWWQRKTGYKCRIASWTQCTRSQDQSNLVEQGEEEELLSWTNSFDPPSSLLAYQGPYDESVMMETSLPEMFATTVPEMTSSITYDLPSVESVQRSPLCACRPCLNSSAPSFLSREQEVSSRVQEIIAELKVEKSSVSATIRKVTSAKDRRPSSQVIGTVGIVTLLTVVGCLIFSDVVTLGYRVYKCSRKLRTKVRNRGRLHVAVDEGLPTPVYASDWKPDEDIPTMADDGLSSPVDAPDLKEE